MPGVMWMSRAGACTLVASSPILLAASVAPLGRRKIFLEVLPNAVKGSVGVPTLEVAPLLTMAEGIVRLRTPRLSSASSWKYTRWMLVLVTLATRLVGKRDVVAMDLWRAARLVFASFLFLIRLAHRAVILLLLWGSAGRHDVMLPFPCSMVTLLSGGSCSLTWQGGGDSIE
jgi:hypothetical protein